MTAGKTVEVLKDHSGLNKCRDSKDPLYVELAQQLCKLQPYVTFHEISVLWQQLTSKKNYGSGAQ